MTQLRVKTLLHPLYHDQQEELTNLIENYDELTTYLFKGTRNSIKIATLSTGQRVAIKSFKIPNIFNQYVYKFFRKPKGLRSFEHAERLKKLGVANPQAVAYFEYSTTTRIRNTFYISVLVDAELTYRDLITQKNYPNREVILEEFVRFSYGLHEKGINFLDHSPGNTLIEQKENGAYKFYLVDLNRMKFDQVMSFTHRMKNLAHLTTNIQDIEKMAEHYARLIGKNSKEVFIRLWLETIKFQFRFYKKKDLKFKIKRFYFS
ncbi:lipopolysaccharide kinase InaA family protein [Myroides sp. WP-1]|uniref:lipopolysaccharide kinase InaA family protein n=1 Tax=Myroides sp. WP-1 TaxID=2759944 RepID=UPI0015FC3F2A|nr:lipopolysaccharide kinase InaA family protein [Myroides sp. WP-1]MBB1138484.1 Kdo domain containing protein [Myroides sp. WP-1]